MDVAPFDESADHQRADVDAVGRCGLGESQGIGAQGGRSRRERSEERQRDQRAEPRDIDDRAAAALEGTFMSQRVCER